MARVYDWERELAVRQMMDVEYAVRIGRVAGLVVMRRTLAQLVADFRAGKPVGTTIRAGFQELAPVVTNAMLYARLKGLDRADKMREQIKGGGLTGRPIVAAQAPGFMRGVRFLNDRLELTREQLEEISKQADRHVVRVIATASEAVQQKMQETVADIFAKGLHVRDGVKALREAWSNAGLLERNSGQIEAIFRTQTQLAYAAGQSQYEQDPVIDEVLWGYKYVTVGDDRVRDTHRLLDGVTLEKDDPFWRINRPPNGWNCRCQVIPLFESRRIVKPPPTVKIGDRLLKPGADEGFRFNPATLFPPVAA